MLLQVILEGIGLGVLLILVCAIGIRKGAVGIHLKVRLKPCQKPSVSARARWAWCIFTARKSRTGV